MNEGDGTGARRPLHRWLAANALIAAPQAAAPIAFALVLLPLTGDANAGAALILAMTAAQVVGAVPVSRLGRRFDPTRFLRVLIGVRLLSFTGIAAFASVDAPLPWLIAAAAAGGAVSAAMFGYLRAALNAMVATRNLPRALGVAATLNELVFVSAPVLASFLGALSPLVAVWALAVLSALPLLLAPRVGTATPDPSGRRTTRPPASLLVWFFCAAASGAAVAVIEIGAVSLAVHYGLAPAWAFVFVVALCVASVLGGVWVSARNRAPRPLTVAAYLAITATGIALLAANISLPTSLIGVVAVGALLAPLGTHYSLTVDRLAAPENRAEAFALLRTAGAVGVIAASATLTFAGLDTALAVCVALMVLATIAGAALMHRAARSTAADLHRPRESSIH